MRRATGFRFGPGFGNLHRLPEWTYEQGVTEGDLSNKMLAAFFSISVWVKGANGKPQVFNKAAPPPDTNISFNLVAAGVLY